MHDASRSLTFIKIVIIRGGVKIKNGLPEMPLLHRSRRVKKLFEWQMG